jgi:endoglucanase
VLSNGLPGLKTLGNRIVRSDNSKVIRLRGLNRSGLEYAAPLHGDYLKGSGICADEFDVIAGWGANLIRLPFCQQRVLSDDPAEAAAYLSALDGAIGLAAKRGMYTLLDLQWLDASVPRGTLANGKSNFVAPLPDERSAECWILLANRYSEEPAVLYDIFNEPHDPLLNDPEPLLGVTPYGGYYPLSRRRVGFDQWTPWAAHLVRSIRANAPDALIFVSGIDWGYNLKGFPIDDLSGVVYSSHVYPSKGPRWNTAFGNLSREFPVFIAEWGGTEADLSWGRKLVNYLDERELGWAAWSWCDYPRLTFQNADYRPTPFGELVQTYLNV